MSRARLLLRCVSCPFYRCTRPPAHCARSEAAAAAACTAACNGHSKGLQRALVSPAIKRAALQGVQEAEAQQRARVECRRPAVGACASRWRVTVRNCAVSIPP